MLHLGVCLPRTCDPKDITTLLHAAGRSGASSFRTPKGLRAAAKGPSMEVVRIRKVPGPYVLMADTKLHILA